MELRDYVQVLRRRWKWVALGFIACLAVAEVFVLRATPQYQSQTQVFISTQSSNSDTAYQGSLFSGQRVASYADLANGPDIAEAVIEELELDLTPEQLSAKVTAQALPQTVLLSIAVRDADPEVAKALANEYADQLGKLVAELETPPGKEEPVLKATTVETAGLPTAPVSPNIVRTLLLGGVVGLLLGFGLAMVRELFDTSAKTAGDIESTTEAPVLGWIHQDPTVGKSPLVSSLSPHHPRMESFRVLRTNLQFIDVDSDNKAFVISSAVPGEGKSTTATNAAITLAMAGKRVLLVDADLRRPRVATVLGLEGMIGLTSLLVGQVEVQTAIQKHESGLDVIAAGAVPPNPAELLQSHAMTDLVAQLRKLYDVVVFDAPPLLPVTDAAILASKTDGAVLVVRHGKTTKEQIRGAVERLTNVGAHPLGVVFNRVPAKRSAGGYGYGYGYGYAPVEEKLEAPAKRKRGTRKADEPAPDAGKPQRAKGRRAEPPFNVEAEESAR